jgi:DNA-directed RNA polymerase specialized sigma24 family protein
MVSQDEEKRTHLRRNARRKAMPRPFGSVIELQEELRSQLESLVRARSTPQALALRCRIVLHAAAADNPSNQEIAAKLGCNRHTVGQWRERFVAQGLQGLQDAPRSGRPRSFSPLRAPDHHHSGQ